MATLNSKLIISLIDRATGPARGLAATMNHLRSLSADNARAMEAMRGRMVDAAAAGYVMAKALSTPVKAAIEFESAMADVKKVVDFESPEAFKDMSKAIIDMSTRIPLAATGLGAIMAAAGQAGIAGPDLLTFTEMAAKVGVAFGVSADEAGENLAKIKTALGMTVEETGILADAINYLSNTSASEAPDLLNFMRRVGSSGKQFGFTAEQTAAIGSAMISAGFEADVAATSFRNIGLHLSKGAGATARQSAAFRLLNLSSKKVAKDMQRDAVGTLNDVLARIRNLPAHLRSAAISDLFGDEARAIAPLIENADILQQSLNNVADRSRYLGSSTKEYEIRAATAENALMLLKNQAIAVAIAIGSTLLPAIVKVTETLGPYVRKISDLVNAYPRITAGTIGIIASLVGLRVATIAARWAFLFLKGGVIDAAIGMVHGTQLIVAASKRMRLAILGATMLSKVGGGGFLAGLVSTVTGAAGAILAAVGGIATAIAGITAPVWGAIAVVVGAVAGLALSIRHYWEPISNFIIGFGEGIYGALAPMVDAIAGFGARIAGAVGSWAVAKIVDFGALIGIEEATIRAAIDSAISTISSFAGTVVTVIKAIPGQLGGWITEIFAVRDYSAAAEAGFRETGRLAGEALVNSVKSAVGGLIDWFSSLPSRIAAAIGNIDIGSLIKWPSLPAWMGGGTPPPAAQPAPAIAGARAAGGPVVAGRTYLTGERGRELFTPSQNGYVHDAQTTAAMMRGSAGMDGGRFDRSVSITNNITIHSAPSADPNDLAREVAKEMSQRLKDNIAGLQADLTWAVG